MVQSGARKKECLRILFWLIPCALLFTAAPSPVAAQFNAWVMAKLPDTPEGLGVDSHGNLYATLMHMGKSSGSTIRAATITSRGCRRRKKAETET
jgi:hypothetical protein